MKDRTLFVTVKSLIAKGTKWQETNQKAVLQKGQEGAPRKLQVGQPHLCHGKDDGAAHSRGHHQASGGEGYQE